MKIGEARLGESILSYRPNLVHCFVLGTFRGRSSEKITIYFCKTLSFLEQKISLIFIPEKNKTLQEEDFDSSFTPGFKLRRSSTNSLRC